MKTIGIQVKHYSSFFGNPDSWEQTKDFGPSATDTSHWRPDISIARAQAGINDGKKLLYDFPDGKDTGSIVQTYVRSKGLDITEVETAEKRITQIIEHKKKDDKKKAEDKAQLDKFNENIQKLADSVDSASSDSSSNTNS